MELGFNTGIFPDLNLKNLVDFASENNFSAIEIICNMPNRKNHLDIEEINSQKAEEINHYLRKKNVAISCISYYSNPLAGNEEREDFLTEINYLINTAAPLGIKNISTFSGFAAGCSVQQNIEMMTELFKPILEKAAEYNINILFENSPVIDGDKSFGNIAYSPEIWDLIFTSLPNENFGLNYDPSHLFWLGIDYMLFLDVFKDRIFHVQAKDSEILIERLRMTGILGQNWFRYRLPGFGSIDWKHFISSLYENGYDGYVSIENEDFIWLDNEERKKRGILLGKKSLENLII